MNRALIAGAAGMSAQQAVIDAIAVNLANADTPGYRAQRPEFAALVAPDGRRYGVGEAAPRTLVSQGRLDTTASDTDLAVDGPGWFVVRDRDGRRSYTRAGDFAAGADGLLRLPGGAALDGVRLPKNALSITVAADGRVSARVPKQAAPVACGRVRLATFADPSSLRPQPDGTYRPPDGATPSLGVPDAATFGTVRQRCLERANVGVVSAMMAVLAAQRAYEANAKTVQAADEMLRLANNLQRG